MNAFHLELIDRTGLGTRILGPLLVVAIFVVALGLVAGIRFRAGEAKVAWA